MTLDDTSTESDAPVIEARPLRPEDLERLGEPAEQVALDAACEEMCTAARRRLAEMITGRPDALDALDALEELIVAGYPIGSLDLADLVERVRDRALADRESTAELAFVSPAGAIANVADTHDNARLVARLAEGWTLTTRAWSGYGAAVDDLVEVSRIAFPGASVQFSYGIRSALGQPIGSDSAAAMLVQLLGRQSLGVSGPTVVTGQSQVNVTPGSIVVLPAKHRGTPLPLDEDNAWLVVSLPTVELGQIQRAQVAVVATSDLGTRRRIIEADTLDGVRLCAPGGLHLLGEPTSAPVADGADDAERGLRRVALGGQLLTIDGSGFAVLESLFGSDHRTVAEVAGRTAVDADDIEAFIRRLLETELLDVAAPEVTVRRVERLTQVASAGLDAAQVVGAILPAVDESSWRPPTPGEVPPSSHGIVEVQQLGAAPGSALAMARAVVHQLNAQFFELDLFDGSPPPLLVRIRAGSDASGTGLQAMSADWVPPLLHDPHAKVMWVIPVAESAAVGGWPELAAGSPIGTEDLGAVSAWPALRSWRFSAMTAGERLFVFGRLQGPSFR
ncbi:MAG: hypothetical protein AAF567_19235 [Actinomycetota bacterium]